jgi:uncharacterized protein (TIGR04255 family)
MGRPLGKLEDPPITEVVCGILFKPIPGLDPVSLGSFWKARQKEFPRREFKAPIAPAAPEAIEFSLGPDLGPLRTWLISKDDVFIIQVQQDRFYLNWRARQDEYPRFNDRDGKQGLLARFMSEQSAFERYCAEELGARLEIQAIELAKIDHLERGRHWRDPRDLGALLPMLVPALDLAEQDVVIAVRLATPRENGSVDITLDTILKIAQPPIPVVKLECRRTTRRSIPAGELAGAFKEANRELNELFSRLIPVEQHVRFTKGWR